MSWLLGALASRACVAAALRAPRSATADTSVTLGARPVSPLLPRTLIRLVSVPFKPRSQPLRYRLAGSSTTLKLIQLEAPNATTPAEPHKVQVLFPPETRAIRSPVVLDASNRSSTRPWQAHWPMSAVPAAGAARQSRHACSTLHFPQAAARCECSAVVLTPHEVTMACQLPRC